jgi:hypothetical protein
MEKAPSGRGLPAGPQIHASQRPSAAPARHGAARLSVVSIPRHSTVNPLSRVHQQSSSSEENTNNILTNGKTHGTTSFRDMQSDRFLQLSAPEQAAVFEHRVVAHSCSSTAVLRREFGKGIYGYFVFLQFLLFVNLLLTIISGSIFGAAYKKLLTTSSFAMLFTGVYPSSMRVPWLAATSAVVALPFVAGLMYPVVHKRLMENSIVDTQDAAEGGDNREDLTLRMVTHREKRIRRIMVGICFVTMIAAQAVITYFLYDSLANSSEGYASVVVAFSNNALNFCQKFISKRLTHMELHSRISSHRAADTKKLFAVKFFNVLLLYIIKAIIGSKQSSFNLDGADVLTLTCIQHASNATVPALNATSTPAPVDSCDCPLVSQGWTFFWLLVFDVAFSVLIEPFFAFLNQRYRKCSANRRGLSDYDVQLDFDVAEELVSVLYRQFIILLGAPVFPLITAFGFIAYLIEYYMDRIKLVNLCKKTIIREESMDLRLIVACTLVVSVAAAFSYPQGMIFVGLGYHLDDCSFFA